MPPPTEEIDPDFFDTLYIGLGFPSGSAGKESTCNEGDLGSIPRLGRSPGEGKGYPLQYSGLKNSMDFSPWGCKKTWLSLHFISGWPNVHSGFSILSMENLNYLANSIQGFSWVSLECMLGVGVGVFFLEKKDRNIHSQRTKHEEWTGIILF